MGQSDKVAAEVAAIRERAEQITATHTDEDCEGGDPCTGHDALRMADGYDALLQLADEWHAKGAEIWAQVELQDCDEVSAGFKAVGGTRFQSSAKELRAAITAALTGEDRPGG